MSVANGIGSPVDEGFTVYEHKSGWAALDLRELWKYHELLYFLTWRDILVRYKQAVLGVAWAILQPLLTMVVFTLVFNRGLGVTSASAGLPYAVFSFAGLLPWQFFSGAITRSGASLVELLVMRDGKVIPECMGSLYCKNAIKRPFVNDRTMKICLLCRLSREHPVVLRQIRIQEHIAFRYVCNAGKPHLFDDTILECPKLSLNPSLRLR